LGAWSFVWGAKTPKDPRGDGTACSLMKMYISEKQTYKKRNKSRKCNEEAF